MTREERKAIAAEIVKDLCMTGILAEQRTAWVLRRLDDIHAAGFAAGVEAAAKVADEAEHRSRTGISRHFYSIGAAIDIADDIRNLTPPGGDGEG